MRHASCEGDRGSRLSMNDLGSVRNLRDSLQHNCVLDAPPVDAAETRMQKSSPGRAVNHSEEELDPSIRLDAEE